MSWQLVAAIVGILIPTAEFIERYHFSKKHQNSLRLWLIKCFFALDNIKISDLADWAMRRAIKYRKWITWPPYILLLVGGIYFLEFVLFLLPSLALSNWLAFKSFAIATKSESAYKKIAFAVFSPIGAVTLSLLYICAVAFVVLYTVAVFGFLSGFEIVPILWAIFASILAAGFIVVTFAPILLVTVCVSSFSLLQASAKITKKALLFVFEAASDPNNTPYRYLSALVSFLLVVQQSIVEIARAIAN